MTENEKIKLFLQQKETLDTFLRTGAITPAQYEYSLTGLKTKLGISEDDK